jgi:branched-chain amino acid aminotransferase
MREVAVINGRVADPERAAVPIDDWGFRYGWGAFDTIRVHKSCPLFLERHLGRLCQAASVLMLTGSIDQTLPLWSRDVRRSIERAGAREAFINLYWTGRQSMKSGESLRLVRVRKLNSYPRRAARLWVAPWRIEPTYPGVAAKTLAYFPYIFAGVMAREAGFDEALILNTSNRVADGGASSVFVISAGQVVTPSLREGTLAGITRGLVLELAAKQGLEVRQGRIRWKDLAGAEGVFVTSALRGVVPVSRIADQWSGRTERLPRFRALQDAYRQEVADEVRRWRARCARS